MRRSTPPVQRRSRPPRAPLQAPAWQFTVAFGLTIAVSLAGMHVLFREQSWWMQAVVVVFGVLAACAGVRVWTSARLLPTLGGLVALMLLTTLFFLPGTAIVGIVPTLDTLAAIPPLLRSAGQSVYTQAIPAIADPPIAFAIATAAGLIAVLVDLVGITLRRPALVGVPVVAVLSVPAFVLPEITDPVVFVLTAAGYLAILVLSSSRRQPGLAAAIGAVAIIGTLLLPNLLPRPDRVTASPVEGFSAGVNPVLDLGDDLRRANPRTVLDYTTASGSPHYLRLVTLENFTGDRWSPTEREIDTSNTVDDFGVVPGLDPAVLTESEVSTIDIRNFESLYLPVPYPAQSIDGLSDDWYFDAVGRSVSSPSGSPRDQEYEVTSLTLEPTPEQLLSAGTTVTDELQPYLALPEDLPPVISDTASDVAGAAATNYERAIALQEYFRSPEFTYSEDAPVEGDYDGTGMDVIATFLGARSGYCVHFSSAMAVMARTLGIPARVVVGFLPGSADPDSDAGGFEVTTYDLHAWPELYFDGIGWVQFEPTPGRGEVADYADVTQAGVPLPSAPAEPIEPTVPSAPPSPSPSASTDGMDIGQSGTAAQSAPSPVPWILLGILVAGLLSLVPAAIRAVQRRVLAGRLARRDATAIDAWREVTRTAVDLRIDASATGTPRETAASFGVGGAPLARLLAATEEKGYAATTLTDPRTLARDIDAVRRSLRATVPARERLGYQLYPASIWRRVLNPLRSE